MSPNEDYTIDLQHGTKPYRTGDAAADPLFSGVTPGVFRKHPTYVAFHALLDNYERCTGVAETVSAKERKENTDFLNLCMKTAPMQYAHRYLVNLYI